LHVDKLSTLFRQIKLCPVMSGDVNMIQKEMKLDKYS
jgi:hypothetical protein